MTLEAKLLIRNLTNMVSMLVSIATIPTAFYYGVTTRHLPMWLFVVLAINLVTLYTVRRLTNPFK